ncbi:MAG: cysteine hydrolase [Defluviitaleaceae bacterium]|nr:cysteine hydrolase [Defluviitaleaceae bacterium]
MYKVLIVVDMQNDFITGSLGTPEAEKIVCGVAERIKNSLNEMVIFTQDTHNENYLDTPEGKKLPVMHCIEETHGWQIEESIVSVIPPNAIHIFFKKPIFGSVEMAEFLKERRAEIESIEILGLCTDICVVSNAIILKNYLPEIPIAVNAALCAGVTPQSHQEAVNTMMMCHIDII